MNIQLKNYKKIIDDLVKIRPAILKRWVTEKGWSNVSENKEKNALLSKLTDTEKSTLGEMIQQAKDEGIHDTLAYLNEQINKGGLKIMKDGVPIAVEPYGTELFWDWLERCEGNEWAEDQLKEKYTKP